MKFYTGVGSRETPEAVLQIMERIGAAMARKGWTLRSGAADGADAAFERGCDSVDSQLKEIFLPWKNFNNHPSPLYEVRDKALLERAELIISVIHPRWKFLTFGAKKLHTRNVFQVLGQDLEEPSEVVFCWTKNGKAVGGTATAINLAGQRDISVINLATMEVPEMYLI